MGNRRRKTWREKLADCKDLPRVIDCPTAHTTIAIPAPCEIDALMKQVPIGKLVTIRALRDAVARRHGAREGCPLTTGIFAWIAAHAAEEARSEGEMDATPYWRTLKARGELNPKYPGGIEALTGLLEAEGHEIVRRGRKYFVKDHERDLIAL